MNKKIKSALISVFYKDGLDAIVKKLHQAGVIIYTTGGTQKFIEGLGLPCVAVEGLTSYPSILGGRVKTLHPSVFGGILGRRNNPADVEEMSRYNIPEIDLVIVDLYPFEETVASTTDDKAIIEKIISDEKGRQLWETYFPGQVLFLSLLPSQFPLMNSPVQTCAQILFHRN